MKQELDRFTKYVNLYQKLVIRNAEQIVDHQMAEDIAQETFLKMLDYLDYLQDEKERWKYKYPSYGTARNGGAYGGDF